MDWNTYLYTKIRERVSKYPEKSIFQISDSLGNITPFSNQAMLKSIEEYSDILKSHKDKICAVYHEMNEEMAGFIVAAFRCHVKILIKKTTLDIREELSDDIRSLQKTVPIQLIFTEEGIRQIASENRAEKDRIQVQDTDFGEKDYDFIQLSSGTTDSSKAFCLSAEGLIKSAMHIQDIQHVGQDSVFLSYLTLTHIFGFVSGFILPIISGAAGLFCKINHKKRDAALLFKIMSAEKVTHTSAVMSTLFLGLEKKDNDWDLSDLVCVSLGGEMVDITNYESLLKGMAGLGMPEKALVNSYGMSEKGSIAMEDPFVGNSLYEKDGKRYVSVGDERYHDIEIIVFDENYNAVGENVEGMIGVCSPYLAKYFFHRGKLHYLNTVKIGNQEYYHNGDCGFVNSGKVFVTGRKVNTITYNGLKVAAEVLNEKMIEIAGEYGLNLRRCFCFNYPEQVNYVVCFMDYDRSIDENIKNVIRERIMKECHVNILDFWNEDYNGNGLEKISLPDMIRKYTLHLNI